MSYQVFVHRELAFEMPLNSDSLGRIMAFLRSLSEVPRKKADFVELDSDKEPQYTKIIDDCAVGYLLDLGKSEVTVNQIEPVDRQQVRLENLEW